MQSKEKRDGIEAEKNNNNKNRERATIKLIKRDKTA